MTPKYNIILGPPYSCRYRAHIKVCRGDTNGWVYRVSLICVTMKWVYCLFGKLKLCVYVGYKVKNGSYIYIFLLWILLSEESAWTFVKIYLHVYLDVASYCLCVSCVCCPHVTVLSLICKNDFISWAILQSGHTVLCLVVDRLADDVGWSSLRTKTRCIYIIYVSLDVVDTHWLLPWTPQICRESTTLSSLLSQYYLRVYFNLIASMS